MILVTRSDSQNAMVSWRTLIQYTPIRTYGSTLIERSDLRGSRCMLPLLGPGNPLPFIYVGTYFLTSIMRGVSSLTSQSVVSITCIEVNRERSSL